ncbi:fucose permease [Streptomyces sp. Ag109_O5-1]|uniref:MFS transporter n=1 Tax=Streptomyces sp. Ag109_O5-1 TaxID=1938851 RepID=UPI000F9638E0|nr:MFS transporter [Streptomyces sp. Ag109_O5-1]RPE38942.1 fucose permease [Streptomyces sp. Ag109_O5-1]
MNAKGLDRGLLLRGRTATSLLFLLFGTALGVWTSRIPSVKHHLGLSDGSLSLALLAFSAGAIAGMLVLGRLADRWGSTRVMVPTAVLEGLLLIPPAYMPSLAALMLALFLFGLTHGTLNIAMNANAIQVQRAWGRPIMSSFHAVYSVGGFLGSTVGGFFARQDVGPRVTFIAVGAVVVVLAVWAAVWALPRATMPTEHEEKDKATTAWGSSAQGARAGGSVVSPALVFLGVLAMCALVGEGTAADWSAVYLHESLGSSQGFAATAFAAFSVAMTVGRLLGDRLAARYGPVRLVRTSGVLASVGMTAALLIDRPLAGVIGFACLGAGMACIAPQVYSAAGQRDPARAGAALSLVVSLGYTGFLIGPIVVGSVSTFTGLPVALGIPTALVLFVALGASALRPPDQDDHAAPAADRPETASRTVRGTGG